MHDTSYGGRLVVGALLALQPAQPGDSLRNSLFSTKRTASCCRLLLVLPLGVGVGVQE